MKHFDSLIHISHYRSLLLHENQQKTQQAVVVTGLVVGVLTPLVMIAINKLL